MLNYEQYMSALRWFLNVAGVYLIGKGVGDAALWAILSGAVLSLAPLGWSLFRHTKIGTLLAADNLSEVAGIITKSTTEGIALAKETPAGTVVPAGSSVAATIAKVN